MTRDTLIKGARVLDGTGAPWFRADVRLSGGFITGIGPDLSAADAAVVEAEDRYLAPGFIDAHCHDDLAFLREPDRPEKALQGVTSIVVGNCSFSLYPAPPHAIDLLRGHFGGLLGETAQSEVFADFSGYRAALEAPGIALNLVSLVGHAALRLAVMGYERRPRDGGRDCGHAGASGRAVEGRRGGPVARPRLSPKRLRRTCRAGGAGRDGARGGRTARGPCAELRGRTAVVDRGSSSTS